MSKVVHVVLFGQSGAGKSRLGNRLLESSIEEARFIEGTTVDNGRAFGCQYIPANIKYRGKHLTLCIVDTPGIFPDGVTTAAKSWNDIVKAVNKSEKKVDVFVIVLKFTEVGKNEEVITSFVDFFGTDAPLNAVVVFTHIEKDTTEREVRFRHDEYLQKHMKSAYPCLLWREDDIESSVTELKEMIVETNKLQTYTNDQFAKAQMGYTTNWIRHQKKKLRRKTFSSIVGADDLVKIGIPDVLIEKILSDTQKRSLIRLAKSKV